MTFDMNRQRIFAAIDGRAAIDLEALMRETGNTKALCAIVLRQAGWKRAGGVYESPMRQTLKRRVYQ
ncbi:hypothetical protein ACRAQ6_14025 [Erythrobacter sp. HA6-11]